MGCASSTETVDTKKAEKGSKPDKKEKKEKKEKSHDKEKKEKKSKDSGSDDDSDKKKKKKDKDSSSSSSDEDSSHSERGSARSAGSEQKSDYDSDKEEEKKPVEEAPEEVPEVVPVDTTWEPIVISKYVCHKASKSWRCQNPCPDYKNVFTGIDVTGDNGWAHGHNVLKAPGNSSIKATFRPPMEGILKAHSNAKFVIKVGYFAPWNMNPCTATVKVNGEVQKADIPVKGEHKGRTHTGCVVKNLINGEDNTIEVDFQGGQGILYMWYFELKIAPKK